MHKHSQQHARRVVVSPASETIVAQSTPVGAGAIALIRLSGADAVTVGGAMACLASGKALAQEASHTIHHGWVIDANGERVDSVLFFLMRAPRTFSGEDTVEISCHNNQFIVERIITRAMELGARMAQPGEFCERAVLNGKIDLLQAEAINDVIHANTQQALKMSLAQLDGSLSRWVLTLERQLLEALTLCEASFEFLDDETITFDVRIRHIVDHVLNSISSLKKSFCAQQHIRQGIRITLLGAVNAGKSSLLNALLGRERAIVSAVAGTTRDTVEVGVYRDGSYWTLIDTAGIRQTQDVIEQEGIRRSFSEAQQADIIILVIDGARESAQAESEAYRDIINSHEKKIILALNKSDLPSCTTYDWCGMGMVSVRLCAQTGEGIDLLDQLLKEKVAQLLAKAEAPFFVNERQHRLLCQLEQALLRVQPLFEDDSLAYEILSHHLRDALSQVTELTGKSIQERGMDAIFRSFCVGK